MAKCAMLQQQLIRYCSPVLLVLEYHDVLPTVLQHLQSVTETQKQYFAEFLVEIMVSSLVNTE
jgi:hypothetical protein